MQFQPTVHRSLSRLHAKIKKTMKSYCDARKGKTKDFVAQNCYSHCIDYQQFGISTVDSIYSFMEEPIFQKLLILRT